jgi:hypothetical protein
MTGDDARARRLAKHARYNISIKGQRRNMRYEAKHPERKLRWETARNVLNHGARPPAAELDPEGDPWEA